MKKVLTLLVFVALAMSNLWAGNVGQQRAQRIGEKFLATTALGQQRIAIQLDLVQVAALRGEVDYYVFNNRGGNGFVIVAGDDRVKPILAYATTGSFDPEDVADGFEFTLSGYRAEIQYVREHNMTATPDVVAEWRSVDRTGSLNPSGQTRVVLDPLCQTIWNQNFPWNSQCPEDPEGNGGYVYAGCVATAMGQVMKFFDWPNQGTGSHSYHPSGYGQQTANFGDTEYHFELMPLALDSTSTEEDYYYVAQFLHHCGIAVDMQYSGSGSGAYSDDVPTALRNYFRYSCDDHITNYNFWGWGGYSNEEWAQMLKDGGLDEHIPLYYSGQDDTGAGGHAFVCDGYDENDYFHYNWGWSGRDDAWCPIGALNTTKYAFNTFNGFTGHIVPNNSEYWNRPDSISEFTLSENATMNGVVLAWDNPSVNLNGEDLTSITTLTIRRGAEVVATMQNVTPGEAMTFEDDGLEPGLYTYSVFVENEAGVSRNVYRTILVGEKCPVTFMLHDDGGDGWKGAAISVTDENGQRIAVITMTEGSELTVTMPLLKGDINFIWNHGWYHSNEEYDTDYECSFTILDYDGNELYVSDELEDGVFMTYNNNCEESPLTCYPVSNLQGEYQWHATDEYGTYLTWDKPVNTDHLHHFSIYRALLPGFDDMVAEIVYDGSASFDYYDELSEWDTGNYLYIVSATFIDGDQQCESELKTIEIVVTDVPEVGNSIEVFPNPTNGLLTVKGQGEMRITVSNMLGQEKLNTVVNGQSTLELSRCEAGVYMVRVETANGVSIQKVTLTK